MLLRTKLKTQYDYAVLDDYMELETAKLNTYRHSKLVLINKHNFNK